MQHEDCMICPEVEHSTSQHADVTACLTPFALSSESALEQPVH